MTKKLNRLEDYIPAGDAADLLSQKMGRPIASDYIRKIKGVRSYKVSNHLKLYHREDIENAVIRQKRSK